MTKNNVPNVPAKTTSGPGNAAPAPDDRTGVRPAATLLPPAEPDDEYDSFLLMDEASETPQKEAEFSAVLWPDQEVPEQPEAGGRRMTKESFMKALADAVSRPAPVYAFRDASAKSVLRLADTARAIVDGPPGSGKTWALVRRIFRLAASADNPSDILVLLPGREDKRRLLEALAKASRRSKLGNAWQQVQISTFDAFAARLIENWQEEDPENLRSRPDWSPQTLREAAMLLRDHPSLAGHFRHVLVDDIQNVVGQQAAFLLQLTAVLPAGCGFTYFGDRCQALFDLPSAKSNYASADQLYGQLMRANEDALLMALNGSKRSTDEVTELAAPFREAILSGRPAAVDQAAETLLHNARSQDIPWQDLHPTSLRSLTSGKTLGILTRTKGEALAISNLLYQGGITHNLLLDASEQRWAGWLGRVVLAYDGESLDQESFRDIFLDLYPGANPGLYWSALTATQEEPDKENHTIRDLLAGVRALRDRDDLGISPDEEQAAVTVSTIRMARGREFDTVLLASDLFNGGGYTDRAQREAARRSSAETLAEARLAYVGLTRARKKVYLMMLPLEAVRLSQIRSRRPDGPGRWYKSQIRRLPTRVLKSYRRRSLHAFEVGIDDFVPESFAGSEDAQTYLLTSAPDLPDAEMELRFMKEHGQAPFYGLFDPEQAALQLGSSSPEFMTELTAALGYARNIRRDSVGPEHFPEAFRDVYVQRVVTHIGPAEGAPPHAKIYGDQAVWLGLDVIGFAKAVNGSQNALHPREE